MNSTTSTTPTSSSLASMTGLSSTSSSALPPMMISLKRSASVSIDLPRAAAVNVPPTGASLNTEVDDQLLLLQSQFRAIDPELILPPSVEPHSFAEGRRRIVKKKTVPVSSQVPLYPKPQQPPPLRIRLSSTPPVASNTFLKVSLRLTNSGGGSSSSKSTTSATGIQPRPVKRQKVSYTPTPPPPLPPPSMSTKPAPSTTNGDVDVSNIIITNNGDSSSRSSARIAGHNNNIPHPPSPPPLQSQPIPATIIYSEPTQVQVQQQHSTVITTTTTTGNKSRKRPSTSDYKSSSSKKAKNAVVVNNQVQLVTSVNQIITVPTKRSPPTIKKPTPLPHPIVKNKTTPPPYPIVKKKTTPPPIVKKNTPPIIVKKSAPTLTGFIRKAPLNNSPPVWSPRHYKKEATKRPCYYIYEREFVTDSFSSSPSSPSPMEGDNETLSDIAASLEDLVMECHERADMLTNMNAAAEALIKLFSSCC